MSAKNELQKVISQDDELQLKKSLIQIENRCLNDELELIMLKTDVSRDIAYNLLLRYRDIWEFTATVSTSGDSLIVTLPKKDAKQKGIGKGSPVLIALKRLRFFEPESSRKAL